MMFRNASSARGPSCRPCARPADARAVHGDAERRAAAWAIAACDRASSVTSHSTNVALAESTRSRAPGRSRTTTSAPRSASTAAVPRPAPRRRP